MFFSTSFGFKFISIFNASSTSADPQFDETALLPCLATLTPILESVIAAAVDIFKEFKPSPPVPHVSIVYGFDLTFVAYNAQPYMADTYADNLKMLALMGFATVFTVDKYYYPTDGTVWRLDNNDEFDKLGYTSHHPRGAFALKVREEGVITTLLDVEWNVGKSGAVTPVAILDPIMIEDATVSRATLHNAGFIDALELEIGCKVEVIRSGKIIPKIVRRVE